MHGHWLKGYLRDGKEIKGGGSSGGEGPLIVKLSLPDMTADKSFGEIDAALASGRSVFVHRQTSRQSNYYPVFKCFKSAQDGLYACSYFDYENGQATEDKNEEGEKSATDYPYFSGGAA